MRRSLIVASLILIGAVTCPGCRPAEATLPDYPPARLTPTSVGSVPRIATAASQEPPTPRSEEATPAAEPTRSPEPPTATPTEPPATIAPTATPEPLIPTPSQGILPEPTLQSTVTAATAVVPAVLPVIPPPGRERFGVGVAIGPITDYPVERLGIGWYLNWWVAVDPPRPAGVDFWQMAHTSDAGFYPDAATIRAAASANPGSIWLIGNEPDVIWQNNTKPERYAELYHELYYLLKSADPTCRVAIGGVTQPTPLRLAYLDQVLFTYRARFEEPMPVDIWNVHNFVLREERASWGVDIPPGIKAAVGILYEIEDNDDMDAFRNQILAFRHWMAEHGQRDRPLVVSEYGIPMPPEYGFDEARVQEFLYATFDYFLTATDDAVGYPEDDNRLVQWWAWYSLADTTYPTGNLFDPVTKAPTPLGAAFAHYVPPDSDGGR